MAHLMVEEERVKDLLKQAILEVFQERQDLFYELFAEVFEDLALVRAIKEGEATETASKAEVLQVLESAA
jgi:hypothetical protein